MNLVRGALGQVGIDATADSRRGALSLISGSGTYVVRGRFNPETTLDVFNDAIEQAYTDGFTGFSVAAEMSWVLDCDDGAHQVIVYEALLKSLFASCRASGLCLYDRQRMPLAVINGALATHPVVGSQGITARTCSTIRWRRASRQLTMPTCSRDLRRWIGLLQPLLWSHRITKMRGKCLEGHLPSAGAEAGLEEAARRGHRIALGILCDHLPCSIVRSVHRTTRLAIVGHNEGDRARSFRHNHAGGRAEHLSVNRSGHCRNGF
jgi:hypothetical protein